MPAAAPPDSLSATSGFSGTSRFRITGRLGAGANGVVFAATDLDKGARVALKVLARRDPGSLAHFKREFRAMQELHHPNLVERGELFAEGEHWFFTMELVGGVDFLAYVRGDNAAGQTDAVLRRGPHDSTIVDGIDVPSGWVAAEPGAAPTPSLDVGRLRPALAQLLEGLVALHRAGLVHRDVKPSNVLVTPGGRLVLLDGGLVTEGGADDGKARTRTGISGTVAFMAPEQAEGREVSAAADYYSVGVMLFHALTGRLPFEGDFAEVLQAKLAGTLPEPSEFPAHAPADLVYLCLALLAPDAHRRPSGTDLLAKVGARASGGTTTSSSVAFVGRQDELARLHAVARDAAGGGANFAVLVGESGVGKTTLLRRHLDAVVADASPAPMVVWGRCYERESIPYKAFEGVIEEVAGWLGDPATPDAAAALIPNDDDAALLGLAFPPLAAVLRRSPSSVAHGQPLIEPHERRRRLFDATRTLLHGLARRRSLLLAIDDLHWADADSLALLAEVLRAPACPGLLVVATARPADPPLPLPARAVTIALGNLPAADARRLAAALLADEGGPRAAHSAVEIAADSGGHPLFIQELAHLPGPAPDPMPRTLEAALSARVQQLDQSTRRVLEVLSLAMTPLSAAVAAAAASVDPAEWDRRTALLRGQRFARTVAGSALAIEPYHDRVRQAVLAAMTQGGKQALHARLAEVLSSSPTADAETLAHHFGEAGDRGRELRYAVLAAERACLALAFERAIRLFGQAMAAADDPGTIRSLRGRMADALANGGHGVAAAEQYLAARAGAGQDEILDLNRRAAHHLLQSGRIDEGLAVIAEVLPGVGLQLPRTPAAALLSLLWQRIRMRLRGFQFRLRGEADLPAMTVQRIDASWSAVIGLAMVDNIRSAAFQARNLRLALAAGEPLRVVRALAMEATFLASTGQRGSRRAHRLIEKARAVAAGVQEPAARGFARLCEGAVAFIDSRWAAAAQLCEEAEGIFRDGCVGVSYEVAQAQLFTTWACVFLGRISDLRARVPLLVQRAEERGNLYALVSQSSGLSNVAWLAGDDPQEARRRVEEAERRWSNRSFQFQHYWHLLAHAQIDLYLGDGQAALRRIERQWPLLRRSQLLRIQALRIEVCGLRGRAALAAADVTADPRLLGRAERDAALVAREGNDSANGIAALLRAGVLARRGDIQGAAGQAQRALASFSAAGMALHVLAARHFLAGLPGPDGGAAEQRAVEATMSGMHVQAPIRLLAMLAPRRP